MAAEQASCATDALAASQVARSTGLQTNSSSLKIKRKRALSRHQAKHSTEWTLCRNRTTPCVPREPMPLRERDGCPVGLKSP